MKSQKTACALSVLFALSAAPVMAEGVIKSALDGNAPPYAQTKMDGSIEGLTVDLTKEIAKRLGREITIDAMAFSAILPALQASTYDMLSVPLTATPERSEAFLLTEGIWAADMNFLSAAGGDVLTDFAQLKGKVISTNKGNAYEKWAREHADQYGWTVESYGSLNDAAQAVTAGRADAAIVGTATGFTLAKKNPALQASKLTIPTGQFYSYPVPKSNLELRKQLDVAIECIKADGTAAKLYEKWLGVAPEAGSLEVTPQPGYGPVGLSNYDPTAHELSCK